jgi:hypothetical protein
LSPLEGIVVPTLGAYDLAATLLFPFVVIRLVAVEKQSGALGLMLQAPTRFGASILAKGIVLLVAWGVSLLAGGVALAAWMAIGGHLYAPETWTVVLGYLLRGVLAIGTRGGRALRATRPARRSSRHRDDQTWALDYVAGARRYDRRDRAVHADLRAGVVRARRSARLHGSHPCDDHVLAPAPRPRGCGRHLPRRVAGVAAALIAAMLACVLFAQFARTATSEDRRKLVPAGRRSRAAPHRRAARGHGLPAAEDPASPISIAECRRSPAARQSVSVSTRRKAGAACSRDRTATMARWVRAGKKGDEPFEHGTDRTRNVYSWRSHAANGGEEPAHRGYPLRRG